jgi:hypothetical protein
MRRFSGQRQNAPVDRKLADPLSAERAPVAEIVAAVILPIVGLILAVVLLARGRGAHGAAVLLAAVLSFAVWTVVLTA